MRIIAGRWRGRPLHAPAGEATRPTADRVRETLFSMLISRLGTLDGLRVADLYAGSGALGLEALSRGAGHATFVERDPDAVAAIKANIATLRPGEITVLALDATRLAAVATPFDLVLIDPPYGDDPAPVLAALRAGGWLAPGTWLSIETAHGSTPVADGFTIDVSRKVGKARLTLLRPM
jgi:16S rRNA (guanine966-N2)-methyltransferase